MDNRVQSQRGAPVPGERTMGRVAIVALWVVLLCGLAAVAIVWGWWMQLLATHLAGGVAGALELCVVILMGALGVATIAGLAWACTQAPQVRRRFGR